LLGVFYYINNRPIRFVVPPSTIKMPKDNGWDNFMQASNLAKTIHHMGPLSDPSPNPVWTLPKYEAFMKANAPVFAEIRVGLKKECVCPPQTDRMNPGFHWLAGQRECARTLMGESKYYELIGKPGKAMDSRLDCIDLGVTAPRGGVLITALVGVAIESIGAKDISPVLNKLEPDDLARAAQRIDRIKKKRAPYGDFVREEGRMSVRLLSTMFSKGNPVSNVMAFGAASSGAPSTGFSVDDALIGVKFAFANKNAMARQSWMYYDSLAKELNGPYTGKSKTPVPNDPLIQMLSPVMIRAQQSYVRNETLLVLIEAEVALRRYRADRGRYPGRLDELAPTYLKTVPIDPFGQGKPLRYKAVSGGKNFLLYSIGMNMKDDGGRFDGWKNSRQSGDLVAGKL
jgi:hypothetical protein